MPDIDDFYAYQSTCGDEEISQSDDDICISGSAGGCRKAGDSDADDCLNTAARGNGCSGAVVIGLAVLCLLLAAGGASWEAIEGFLVFGLVVWLFVRS